MSERGGSTTQSGIWYQNSVSALYLGRMCDATVRPDHEQVVEVRIEAPTLVDDVVLTFADGHRTYMEAKEVISVGSEPWLKMWKDLDKQFHADVFRRGKDRLSICFGESRDRHYVLKGLCERAVDSKSYEEWWGRLTVSQRALVGKMTLFSLLRDRVGGKARRRGWFTSAPLREDLRARDEVVLAAPPEIAALRESARACGTILKQHKYTFGDTGVRLERDVVGEIVRWAREAPEEEGKDSVAVLLDRAGMGKTVLMGDVLRRLEAGGVTVLAIKADAQLTGVADRDGLQESLDLPDRVERVVRRLATLEKVVVIVDQIDALSLSMARDQRALGVVLETIARLREIPGVRVLLSCRAFDLSNDPRLDRVEVSRRFGLPPLSDEEVGSILAEQGFDYEALSPATRVLLRTPLHLDLFSRIVEAHGSSEVDRHDALGISTLQDLYALLWRDVVLANIPGAPRASEREEVLRLLTDHMDRRQRTSAPRSVFNKQATEYLEQAARWLASVGILVPSTTGWSFLHQTFFDYCYARRFVEEGESLSETLLEGDKGLRARPELVQVLSYLRGSDDDAYLGEVQKLLRAEGLRVHLRLLLLSWFGSLNAPTDGPHVGRCGRRCRWAPGGAPQG